MFKLEHEKIDSEENRQAFRKAFEKLQPSVHSMAQIKTNMDMVLLSTASEGDTPDDLLASKFHKAMRQLKFALQEAENRFIDIEETKKRIAVLKDEESDNPWKKKILKEGVFVETQLKREENQLWQLQYSLVDQLTKITMYTKIHDKLIEKNGGKKFTNKQFQDEQPEFYSRFIAELFFQDIASKHLGISKSSLIAHQKLTRESFLPDEVKGIESFLAYAPLDPEKGLYDLAFNKARVFFQGMLNNQIYSEALEKVNAKIIEARKKSKDQKAIPGSYRNLTDEEKESNSKRAEVEEENDPVDVFNESQK